MNRWMAMLIAITGGGAAAFAASAGLVAVLYGVLWLYVFGDDSWPPQVDKALNLAIPLFGLALWVWMAWIIWRRLRPRN